MWPFDIRKKKRERERAEEVARQQRLNAMRWDKSTSTAHSTSSDNSMLDLSNSLNLAALASHSSPAPSSSHCAPSHSAHDYGSHSSSWGGHSSHDSGSSYSSSYDSGSSSSSDSGSGSSSCD